MADPARAKKLADRIKVLVAEQLEYRVKDPRLGFVTITDVRVTGDLQHASVFYTVLGGEEERSASAAALESARGKLRSAVGQAIGIRLTPTLEFIEDALPESAAHLEDLLRTAKERDAAVAAAANGAAFAGDADPYKRPVEDEDLALDGVPEHQRPSSDPADQLDDDQPPTPAGPPELLSTEAGPARADGRGLSQA